MAAAMTHDEALEFFTDLGLTVEDNWDDWEELCEILDLEP